MIRSRTTTLGRPQFWVDQNVKPRTQGRQVAWPLIPDSFRQGGLTVQTNGTAAQGATSVTVDPLPADMPVDTILYFGSAGKFARLTGPGVKGATTITVQALVTALADNDAAVFGADGGRLIKAGTVMSEITSGTHKGRVVPRAFRPAGNSDPAKFIAETDMNEDNKTAAMSGFGMVLGGVIFENLLPEAAGGPPATINSTFKTELGSWFKFEFYEDNRHA